MARKRTIEVNEREEALLISLRSKWRYGEVVILMRDGVPQRIKVVTEFDDLGPVDKTKVDLGVKKRVS